MSFKQIVAWWTGVVATLVGGVGGIGLGAIAFFWLAGLSPDDPVGGTVGLLLFLTLMTVGILAGYVIAFSLWLVVSRMHLSPQELLDVAGNTRFQRPGDARLNRRWVAWLLHLYRLDEKTAA